MTFPNFFPKELRDAKGKPASAAPDTAQKKPYAERVKELEEEIELTRKENELAKLKKERQELEKDTLKSKENNKNDQGVLGRAERFFNSLPEPPEDGLMGQSVHKKKRGE
jgi:hypothetical protein